MTRTQKRKFRKLKSRENRIKKHGGLKYRYSDFQILQYYWKLIDLLR